MNDGQQIQLKQYVIHQFYENYLKNDYDSESKKKEKMASLKNLNQLLNNDLHDKKKEVLKKLEGSLEMKQKMRNLLSKMINNGEGLKYLLFSKWKNIPDTNNEHITANKIEAKMNEMISKSLNAGLKPLE